MQIIGKHEYTNGQCTKMYDLIYTQLFLRADD